MTGQHYACVLAQSEVNGHTINTVDMLPTMAHLTDHEQPGDRYLISLFMQSFTLCGRYETAIDANYEHLYRSRTSQRALQLHQTLCDFARLNLIDERGNLAPDTRVVAFLMAQQVEWEVRARAWNHQAQKGSEMAAFDQRGQTVGSQTNVGRGFRQDAQPDTLEGDERYSFELWWARTPSPTSDVKELAWLAWLARAELDG